MKQTEGNERLALARNEAAVICGRIFIDDCADTLPTISAISAGIAHAAQAPLTAIVALPVIRQLACLATQSCRWRCEDGVTICGIRCANTIDGQGPRHESACRKMLPSVRHLKTPSPCCWLPPKAHGHELKVNIITAIFVVRPGEQTERAPRRRKNQLQSSRRLCLRVVT